MYHTNNNNNNNNNSRNNNNTEYVTNLRNVYEPQHIPFPLVQIISFYTQRTKKKQRKRKKRQHTEKPEITISVKKQAKRTKVGEKNENLHKNLKH